MDALHAELVGPFRREPGSPYSANGEVLKIAPSRWYLTGFLVPRTMGMPEDDPTEEDDDDLGAGDLTDDDEDSPAVDPSIKRGRRLPASIGLSVLVPAQTTSLTARVTWADYARFETPVDGAPRRKVYSWSRAFHAPVEVRLPLEAKALESGVEVPARTACGWRATSNVRGAGRSPWRCFS